MPIDVASGAVHWDKRDIRIHGRFPLAWTRSFHSGQLSEWDSPFGPGWTNPYFAKLTRIGKEYQFRGPTGAVIRFPDPESTVDRQGIIRDLGSFHEIARHGPYLRVTQWSSDGTINRYVFQPERNGQWWPLRFIEDAAGNGLELAWDDSGLLKGLRQKHEKRTLVVAYEAGRRISSVAFRHADGRQEILARYGYDADGRFVSAKDAMGYSERYEYDPSGRLIREIAKDGGVFTYKYDFQARCVRTSGLGNYDLKILRYLDHIQLTEETNSLGKSTRYQWISTGQVTHRYDPMGGKTETEYDSFGRIVSKTRPMGERTSFEYDSEGNRCKLIDALGNETVFEYNSDHQVTKRIDANGQAWEKTYDSSNRPITATDPIGNRCDIEYDSTGNPVRLIKANGAVSERRFSEAGNLVEIVDWEGGVTAMTHDDFGRVVKRRDSGGQESIRQYDSLGRISRIAYDYGKTISYQYDSANNVLSVASSAEKPVTFLYGTCRRLLEKRFGNDLVVRYAWGSEPDRLERVINELGETYLFRYDDCGRVSAEIGFDGLETRFKYDLSGRCVGKINPLGQSIAWEIDAMGNVIAESLEGESPTTFRFDKTGNLLAAENAWSAINFERDATGRPVEEKQNGFGISREFGPGGEVLNLSTDADVRFGYTYDGNGQVGSIDANGLGSFGYGRNSRGQVSSIALPGDSKWEQVYDSRGRLIRQAVILPGEATPTVEREYAHDDTGMLLSSVDRRWGKSLFSHDVSMRLTGFATEDSRYTYAVNGAGDPISVSRNGEPEIPFRYGPGGKLLLKGTFEYVYDGAGRLITKSDQTETDPARKWKYIWDAKDRLRSLITPSGQAWEYFYDPFGRRCRKKGYDQDIRFIWDNDVLLHEIEEGRDTRTWGFEPYGFRPLFKIVGSSLYSIILDSRGTPREMLDSSARIVWSAHFDPWGNPLKGTGDLNACPFRLQGQYFDPESGLHYNRFRYFDPGTCRFISRDPLLLAGGFSSYRYTPNPTRWIDPLGLCPEEDKEKLYRAMSREDYETFKETGRMPGTGETSTSPNREFSEDYRGVLVEFELKPGTIAQLEAIGVTDNAPATRDKYPDMPVGEKGWSQTNARFKEENGQTNIQLGKGDALDIFNDNITGHNVLRPG